MIGNFERSMACHVRCSLNCVNAGTADSSKCVECDSDELFIQNQECVESLDCINGFNFFCLIIPLEKVGVLKA